MMEKLEKLLKAILDVNDLGWLEKDVTLIFAVISFLVVLVSGFYRLYKAMSSKINRIIGHKLDPYYTDDEVKVALNNYIETKCQNRVVLS